uniref:Uncharacterized protein n=1 Tax=Palpitomonas bilix TaxID=652834 RepID=A0A7S3GJG1_9EUKA
MKEVKEKILQDKEWKFRNAVRKKDDIGTADEAIIDEILYWDERKGKLENRTYIPLPKEMKGTPTEDPAERPGDEGIEGDLERDALKTTFFKAEHAFFLQAVLAAVKAANRQNNENPCLQRVLPVALEQMLTVIPHSIEGDPDGAPTSHRFEYNVKDTHEGSQNNMQDNLVMANEKEVCAAEFKGDYALNQVQWVSVYSSIKDSKTEAQQGKKELRCMAGSKSSVLPSVGQAMRYCYQFQLIYDSIQTLLNRDIAPFPYRSSSLLLSPGHLYLLEGREDHFRLLCFSFATWDEASEWFLSRPESFRAIWEEVKNFIGKMSKKKRKKNGKKGPKARKDPLVPLLQKLWDGCMKLKLDKKLEESPFLESLANLFNYWHQFYLAPGADLMHSCPVIYISEPLKKLDLSSLPLQAPPSSGQMSIEVHECMGSGATGSVHAAKIVSCEQEQEEDLKSKLVDGRFALKLPVRPDRARNLEAEWKIVQRIPAYQDCYFLGWAKDTKTVMMMLPLGYPCGTTDSQSVSFTTLWVWKMIYFKMRLLESLPLDPQRDAHRPNPDGMTEHVVHRDIRMSNVVLFKSKPILSRSNEHVPARLRDEAFTKSLNSATKADVSIQLCDGGREGSPVVCRHLDFIDFSSAKVEGEICKYAGSPMVRPSRAPIGDSEKEYQVRRLDDIEVFVKNLVQFLSEESKHSWMRALAPTAEKLALFVSELNENTRDEEYLVERDKLLEQCDERIVNWFNEYGHPRESQQRM